MNRFNNMSNVKSNRARKTRSQSADPVTFIPKINKNSKVIDKKRNTMSRDSRFNILLKAGAKYRQNKSQKSLERQSHELKKCTFYPDIQKSSFKSKDSKLDLPVMSSMISDMTNPNHSNLLKPFNKTQDERFMNELIHISPINKNDSKVEFSKKAKATLPYRPLPFKPAEDSQKKVKPYKPAYMTRNKHLARRPDSSKDQNTEDEVVFNTHSTEMNKSKDEEKDMLTSTKERISQIEKDLRKNQDDKRKPDQVSSMVEPFVLVKDHDEGNPSDQEDHPLSARKEVEQEEQTTHFSKLLYQGRSDVSYT